MSLDTFYFVYFLIHTPLTLLVDDTFLIPPKYQFGLQRQLYKFQVVQNKDFIASELPLWMKYFVAVEMVFQLPVFVTAICNYLSSGSAKRFSTWLYPFFLMYGFNAAFTSLQCLVYIYLEGPSYELLPEDVYKLLGLYFPTFLIPLVMCVDFSKRIIGLGQQADGDDKDKID